MFWFFCTTRIGEKLWLVMTISRRMEMTREFMTKIKRTLPIFISWSSKFSVFAFRSRPPSHPETNPRHAPAIDAINLKDFYTTRAEARHVIKNLATPMDTRLRSPVFFCKRVALNGRKFVSQKLSLVSHVVVRVWRDRTCIDKIQLWNQE